MKIKVTTIGNNRYIDITPENLQEVHFGTMNKINNMDSVILTVLLDNNLLCWRIDVSAAVDKMNRESFQGMLSKQFVKELTGRILDSVKLKTVKDSVDKTLQAQQERRFEE